MTLFPPRRFSAGVGVLLALGLAACGASPASTATVPVVFTQVQPAATQPAATEAAAATVAVTDPAAEATATPAVADATATPAVVSEVIATKINLNTAGADEFLTVPGVGNRMVREFQEYRPYTSILQFRREIGKYVEAAQVAEYEKYVFVPVDANAADADTLKQLPGVDDAIAADLIAARPYANNDAFLAALSSRVSAEQLAAAAAYLTTP